MSDAPERQVNYYPFHIGDYLTHTAHLSPIEDITYRRLLDLYYLGEGPLPNDPQAVARRIRMRDYVADVEAILAEFFVLDGDRWMHARCDAELAAMKDKQEKARASAAASVNARRAKVQPQPTDGTAPVEQPKEPSETTVEQPLSDRSTTVELPTPTPIPVLIPPIPPSGGDAPTPIKRKRSREPVPMRDWLDDLKTKGEKPIPEGDPVFGYAEKVGLPIEFLRLAWCEFKDLHAQPGGKRQSDWRRTFRNAVRGNWLHLWWLDGEHFALTTTGHQARKAHEERAA